MLILETDFETSDGAVILIDFTPLRFRDRRSYDANRRQERAHVHHAPTAIDVFW
jgi:hypothetical protein